MRPREGKWTTAIMAAFWMILGLTACSAENDVTLNMGDDIQMNDSKEDSESNVSTYLLPCRSDGDCINGLCLETPDGALCSGPCFDPVADLDGDKFPDCVDVDRDGDGQDNELDNCPDTANANQDNRDGDDEGDACDLDDDGDGVPDFIDCEPMDPSISPINQEECNGEDDDCDGFVDEIFPDSDGDGEADCMDADDDGDLVPDGEDNCPVHPGSADQTDSDDDTLGDWCDPDDDNDFVLDENDNCPLVANPEQLNGDGDSFGDACDLCPKIPDSGVDTDMDGVGDPCDAFPNDGTSWLDYDEDGIGDQEDANTFDWGKVVVNVAEDSYMPAEEPGDIPGDLWPIFRHDWNHSGRSTSEGNLGAPVAAARTYIGGTIHPRGLAIADIAGGPSEELVAVSGGRLVAYRTDGSTLWETSVLGAGAAYILGIGDLDGDDTQEVVTLRAPLPASINVVRGNSGTVATTIDALTGVPDFDNQVTIYAYLIEDVTGDGLWDLYVTAGNPGDKVVVRIYSFEAGIDSPTLAFEWTGGTGNNPGAMVLADLEGDGMRELVMANMANNLLAFPLDGRPFEPLYESSVMRSLHATFEAIDVNNDGDDEIVIMRNSLSTNPDGITVFDLVDGSLEVLWSAYDEDGPDTTLYAPWLRPFADFNGDGELEVVFSVKEGANLPWRMEVRSLATGEVLDTLDGHIPLYVYERPVGLPYLITAEAPTGDPYGSVSVIKGLLWNMQTGLTTVWDAGSYIPRHQSNLIFPIGSKGGLHIPTAEWVQLQTVTAPDSRRLGIFIKEGGTNRTLASVDLETGLLTAEAQLPPGSVFQAPYHYDEGGIQRIAVASNAGVVRLYDAELNPRNTLYLTGGANYSGSPMPLRVVDGDGGPPVVLVSNTTGQTRLLTYKPDADYSLESLSLKEGLLIEGPVLAVGRGTDGKTVALVLQTISQVTDLQCITLPERKLLWSNPVASNKQVKRVTAIPRADGLGDDFILQIADLSSAEFNAGIRVDGKTGDELWRLEGGWPYIGRDGVAVDVNGDDEPEWLTVSRSASLEVIDAQTGLPVWNTMDNPVIDDGSPSFIGVFELDGDPGPELLLSGAYRLTALDVAGTSSVYMSALWSLDTRESSWASVTRIDSDELDDVVLWTSAHGATALRGLDGELLWAHRFAFGGKLPTNSQLSSTTMQAPAMGDINADGLDEVLFGGGDGFLYCLSTANGEPVWTANLRAVVSPPIIADIDAGGYSEILTVVGDGYLYLWDAIPTE